SVVATQYSDLFIFFQAEDGIRDRNVTGVQTCALPIYSESVEVREAGLASVSAPIMDANGQLAAVLSISGSVDRFKPSPYKKFGTQLLEAAGKLSASL